MPKQNRDAFSRSGVLAGFFALLLLSASCGSDSGACNGASCAPPASLVGTWTAGSGGTSVTYDQVTGTSSPIGSGLAFRFAADGSYTKAFRSTNGGACGMVMIATESGKVTWLEGKFKLLPERGKVSMFPSCNPGAIDTNSISGPDLDQGEYGYELEGESLLITRLSDGASSVFRRSE